MKTDILYKLLFLFLLLLGFLSLVFLVFSPKRTSHLPKLSEVVLSSEELAISDYPGFQKIDETKDLENICQLDCVKIHYASKWSHLSITLIRSSNTQEISKILQDFRADLHDNRFKFYDFSPQDYHSSNLPASWGIVHKLPDELFGHITIMLPYGEIAIIVSKEIQVCWNTEEGELFCDADMDAILYETANTVVAQIEKISKSGYKSKVP